MLLSRLSPISALITATHADCFSHDGIKAQDSKFYTGPELVSCGNGTNNCCMSGQKCGTNLLCVDGGGGVSRQYCSTASWDGCSDICSGGEHAGVALLDCGKNIYCCQSGSTERDCCTDERAFYVDPDDGSVVQTMVPVRTKAARWFAVDSEAVLGSTVATLSPSFSSEQTRTSTYSFTTSLSESYVPSPTVTNPPDASSKKISAGAGAGIGIGVAAGVAIIGAMIWLLLRRRKQDTSVGAVGEGLGYTTSASVDEKSGPPQTYYSHGGPLPRELDGGQIRTHELDGGGEDATKYELDGTGSKIPLNY